MNALVAAAYEGRMYPGVSVAGVDLSGLDRHAAYSRLQALPQGRTYAIKVGDKVFQAGSSMLGAEYDITATVDLAYRVGRSQGLPLLGVFSSAREGQLGFSYDLDYGRLQKFTTEVVASVGRVPQNAQVVVKDGQVVIVPDAQGLQVNRQEVAKLLSTSLADAQDATFVLEPQPVEADIKLAATGDAAVQTKQLLQRVITLTYGGKNYTASPTNVGYWIEVTPDRAINASGLTVAVSETQVRGYVQSVANQVNKNPVSKKVTVSNGVSTVDREGVTGLAVDQEAAARGILDAMRANQDATIALQVASVPYKTETSQSRVLDQDRYIEINLKSQHLWAYEHGQVVYSSPITSGATGAGLGTAQGTFAIYYKARNTYLNGASYGYNYNVFVKYWMPFYLGFGLHDASWRSSFGGSDYYYGGSHGCVNLPDATAAFIYDWAPVGTTVWVHI